MKLSPKMERTLRRAVKEGPQRVAWGTAEALEKRGLATIGLTPWPVCAWEVTATDAGRKWIEEADAPWERVA